MPYSSGFGFRTGVLPHGAVISCLLGYYDPCEPILSNQAKRPYPSLVIEGRQDRVSRSIQDTTTDEFRHPPVIEGTPTRWLVLLFLSKKISCFFKCIEAVAPHIMRAQTRVIDPHRVCFIFHKGTVGSILVFSHDATASCCGFLNVAMLTLRTPPRTPKLCPNRLPQSGASPSRSLLGINDLPSPTAIISGSPNLSVADARPLSVLPQKGIRMPFSWVGLFGYCPVRQELTYSVSSS